MKFGQVRYVPLNPEHLVELGTQALPFVTHLGVEVVEGINAAQAGSVVPANRVHSLLKQVAVAAAVEVFQHFPAGSVKPSQVA